VEWTERRVASSRSPAVGGENGSRRVACAVEAEGAAAEVRSRRRARRRRRGRGMTGAGADAGQMYGRCINGGCIKAG
jgi:hypothetical protein